MLQKQVSTHAPTHTCYCVVVLLDGFCGLHHRLSSAQSLLCDSNTYCSVASSLIGHCQSVSHASPQSCMPTNADRRRAGSTGPTELHEARGLGTRTHTRIGNKTNQVVAGCLTVRPGDGPRFCSVEGFCGLLLSNRAKKRRRKTEEKQKKPLMLYPCSGRQLLLGKQQDNYFSCHGNPFQAGVGDTLKLHANV